MRKLKRNYLQKRLGKGCGKEVLRQRLSSLKHTNFVGAASALALALLALVILSPTVSEGANAESEAVLDEATMGIEINNQSVVSIALDSKTAMDIIPKAGGSVEVETARVKITTNSRDGYKIFMSSSGDLANINEPDEVITSINKDSILNNFPVNTWGYSISDNIVSAEDAKSLTFSQIANDASLIREASSSTGTDTYTLAFGTKVDPTLAAGRYSTQVTISAVTNPLQLTGLKSLTYMQDMTHEICAQTLATNAPDLPVESRAIVTPGNEPSKRLIDIRDGSTYWVSKLADQNCWMTQNLALDITPNMIAAGSLNSSNTDLGYTGTGQVDIASGTVWSGTSTANSSTDGLTNCPEGSLISEGGNCAVVNGKSRYVARATKLITESSQLGGVTGNIDTQSWNFGKYVHSRPQWVGVNKCGNASWLGLCVAYGVYDVSDTTKWQPTYDAAGDVANAGKTEFDYKAIKCTEGTETYDAALGKFTSLCTAGEYDPHYLLGNYYQLNTITAGSSGTNAGTNAVNSICPKGWKLPVGGSYSAGGVPDTSIDDSYARLFSLYNFVYDKPGSYGNWQLGASNPNADGLNIANEPFYITFGGEIREIDGNNVLTDIGGTHLLTSTILDGASGQFLYPLANIDGVWPTTYWVGFGGFSARCIAR